MRKKFFLIVISFLLFAFVAAAFAYDQASCFVPDKSGKTNGPHSSMTSDNLWEVMTRQVFCAVSF